MNKNHQTSLKKNTKNTWNFSKPSGCKRGLPLYPAPANSRVEPTVTIVAGEHLGLDKWMRFSPAQADAKRAF